MVFKSSIRVYIWSITTNQYVSLLCILDTIRRRKSTALMQTSHMSTAAPADTTANPPPKHHKTANKEIHRVTWDAHPSKMTDHYPDSTTGSLPFRFMVNPAWIPENPNCKFAEFDTLKWLEGFYLRALEKGELGAGSGKWNTGNNIGSRLGYGGVGVEFLVGGCGMTKLQWIVCDATVLNRRSCRSWVLLVKGDTNVPLHLWVWQKQRTRRAIDEMMRMGCVWCVRRCFHTAKYNLLLSSTQVFTGLLNYDHLL